MSNALIFKPFYAKILLMRRRIKPIVVVVFFALCGLLLVIGKAHSDSLQKQQLASAKDSIPTVSNTSTTTTSTSETDEDFVLNPIIDISGWQLPNEIDYDTLSRNISGAIVRVYGGSQISKDSNAAYTTGIDKSFKTHIKELQKRNVPVAVYSYALGTTVKEMKEEAKIFYKNASPYSPTFYWIDVEEATMSDMNKGVQAFLKELKNSVRKMSVSTLELISWMNKKFPWMVSMQFGFLLMVLILVITMLHHKLIWTMTSINTPRKVTSMVLVHHLT